MSGKKEDFGSFQIGSMPGLSPSKPTPVTSAAVQASPQSPEEVVDPEDRVFPFIEELLEKEDIDELAAQFEKTTEQLDEMIAKRSGRIKIEFEKARKAYQHTIDLVAHLLQVKADLLAGEGEQDS